LGAEKVRRRGRRRAERMLGAKARGITLPGRIVVASRRVNKVEIGGNSQAKSCSRRPQRPVDIREMEAIEEVGVERNCAQYLPPCRQENTVEHGDVAGDRAAIEDIDLPLRFVRRVMRNPASQMRMPAPANRRSG